MKSNRLLPTLFFVLGVTLLGAGCASSPKKETPAVEVDEKDRVSTLPWNTPQKWEKGSGIGAGTSY